MYVFLHSILGFCSQRLRQNPYQPLLPSNPFRHFRPVHSSLDNPLADPIIRVARPLSIRARIGRGGRHHLDRRVHGRNHPLNNDRSSGVVVSNDAAPEERQKKMIKLWSHHNDAGGADDGDERMIIDDFETRFVLTLLSSCFALLSAVARTGSYDHVSVLYRMMNFSVFSAQTRPSSDVLKVR